jgi:hypothetical protein
MKEWKGGVNFLLTSFVSAVALLAVFLPLGARALWDPDEGRYAEIGREMLALKDWIVPHLDYIPYLEKPPLGYWMVASSLALFGRSEWAARLPCAVAGLLNTAVTWRLARSWGGPRMAWLAAGVLLSSLEYYLFTQFLALDMVFTLFFTATLWLFWEGYQHESKRTTLWMGGGAAAGLAALTKGPVGIVLPGLIIFVFLVAEKKLSNAWSAGALLAALAAVLIPSPWLISMNSRVPGFFRFFFLHEQALRFLTRTHGRTGTLFYYVPVILIGFMPWSFLVPFWIKDLWKRNRSGERLASGERFALVWFGTSLIFFSLAGSKLLTYILPAFPALAFLTSSCLERSSVSSRSFMTGLVITDSLAAGALVTLALFHFPAIAPQIITQLAGPISVLILTPLAVGLGLAWNRREAVWISVTLGGLLFGASTIFPTRMIEPYFTTRPLAMEILKHTRPTDVVVSFDANVQEPLSNTEDQRAGRRFTWQSFKEEIFSVLKSPPEIIGLWKNSVEPIEKLGEAHSYAPTYDRRLQSLPFYLERRVSIVGALGELIPGARINPDPEFLLSHDKFRALLKSKTVYGICRTIHYPAAQRNGLLEVITNQADLTLFKNR